MPENLVPLHPVNCSIADDSVVETRINPFQFFSYRHIKTEDAAFVKIRLMSGKELKIKAVQLYDRLTLSVVSQKKSEARKKHQGVSTGLGSIGSLEWVLASSLVIGAVEGVLSSGAAAQGTKLLTEAIQLEMDLRNEGAFLPVGTIKNIEHPLPGIWLVLGEAKSLENGETRRFPAAFIHNGDEFITVQTDDDSICYIRWSAVESYAYQTSKGAQGTQRPPRIFPT